MKRSTEQLLFAFLLIEYPALLVGYVAFTGRITADYPEGYAAAIFTFPLIVGLSLAVAFLAKLFTKYTLKKKGYTPWIVFHITFALNFVTITLSAFLEL